MAVWPVFDYPDLLTPQSTMAEHPSRPFIIGAPEKPNVLLQEVFEQDWILVKYFFVTLPFSFRPR
jgi:hypothetical protein